MRFTHSTELRKSDQIDFVFCASVEISSAAKGPKNKELLLEVEDINVIETDFKVVHRFIYGCLSVWN